MKNYSTAINNQYGQTNLGAQILDSLQSAGKDLGALTLDDLALFNQLHAGGRDATRALATMANLEPGMHVLDIGSGIGGPARTLVENEGAVQMWIGLLAVVLMFPLMLAFAGSSRLPAWVPQVTAWLPTVAAFDLMRLSFGELWPAAEVWPKLAVILVAVALVFATAGWRLRTWEA